MSRANLVVLSERHAVKLFPDLSDSRVLAACREMGFPCLAFREEGRFEVVPLTNGGDLLLKPAKGAVCPHCSGCRGERRLSCVWCGKGTR